MEDERSPTDGVPGGSRRSEAVVGLSRDHRSNSQTGRTMKSLSTSAHAVVLGAAVLAFVTTGASAHIVCNDCRHSTLGALNIEMARQGNPAAAPSPYR